MWVDNYHWHYDYARLAWDTGFSFDKYKYANLDKNKICLIDIERTIRERDVASVDRNISTVVQYVLENDQAEVLDTNFVKLFRLSQLSVEYLLFCKKYLDRTVVLLKKEVIKLKEEVKELKIYTEELETHVSSSKNTPVVSFKCEICSKLFSSEDYLNSHFKKRHNGVDNKINGNSEAEKLHSEIKELKERLNNTEKFIQEKPYEREIDKSHIKEDYKDADDKTTKLVCEIQESFEKFRKQVEEKMCGLQSEKTFFTEKYDKLFEIVLQYKNREQEAVKIEEPKIKVAEYPKIQNTTQTSVEYEGRKNKTKNLQVYTVQHDNIIDIVKTDNGKEKTPVENIDEKIERKLSNFEENIESKISSGLGNIENQIQAFWVKLSEVELNHPQTGDHPVDQQIVKENSPQNKPKIKPRTKLTKQTVERENKNAELVKNELEKILAIKNKPESNKSQVKFESNSELKPTVVKSAVSKMYESSTTEEELSVEEEDKNYDFSENLKGSKPEFFESGITFVKNNNFSVTPKSTIGKNLPEKSTDLAVKKSKSSIMKIALPEKSSTLVKTVDVRDNEKAKKKMRKQLNDVVDASLQEMGISPHWKGIPKKSFERALEIVKHQAFLSKKSLPEYDSLKKSIEKSLNSNKELKKVKEKGQPIVTRDSPNRKNPKRNTVKFQIRKHLPQHESKPDSAVTIKNRSLYDSESETDIKTYLPKNFERKQVHSAVIEELQLKFSEKQKRHQDTDSDSDLNSIVLSNGNNEEMKDTKSALKSSASSEAAFVKKKVFFDVGSDRKKEPGDVRKKEDIEKKKKDENSSVSDFEITD